MTSTRQHILKLLEKHGALTAPDLSHLLDQTAANIRHHLAILINEGVVTIVGERSALKRGRPVIVYSLASQTRLHNLGKLASSLLTELSRIYRDDQKERFLKNLSNQLAGSTLLEKGNLVERLNHATQVLNNMYYQARWEARPVAPMITFRHCPYAAIINEHPEICLMDVYLLERLLNTHVNITAKLKLDSQGLTYCGFHVERSPKPANQL